MRLASNLAARPATAARAVLAAIAALAAIAPGAARADRDTVVTIGAAFDGRATDRSFASAGRDDVVALGGARLSLSFEHPSIAFPEPGKLGADLRLVPELVAGFVADTGHAEGYAGAGLRGELWLASASRRFHIRTPIYLAARGLVISDQHDGAAEFVFGEYLAFSRHRRFGWEGGAMLRPLHGVPASRSRELDALASIYIGW